MAHSTITSLIIPQPESFVFGNRTQSGQEVDRKEAMWTEIRSEWYSLPCVQAPDALGKGAVKGRDDRSSLRDDKLDFADPPDRRDHTLDDPKGWITLRHGQKREHGKYDLIWILLSCMIGRKAGSKRQEAGGKAPGSAHIHAYAENTRDR